MRLKIESSLPVLFILVFSSFNPAEAQVNQNTVHDIQLLMQEKQSRTPVQRKIESQLLQALRESRGQKMVDSVNLEPANINADNTGSFKADITATVSDDLITRIEGLGGTIIYPSWQYHSIRALINFSMIETIAGYADVKFIEPAVGSITVGNAVRDEFKISAGRTFNTIAVLQNNNSTSKRLTFAERAARVRSLVEKYLNKKMDAQFPFTGTVNSQGDHAHRADDVRNTYGYTGQGIRIGILSDSYNALNTAAADVASGNLPGPGNPLGNTTAVTVVQDITGASDEGRAMLQIVHDLAPQAQLFFATADISEAGFATNIQALRNAPYNCDIIVDDVSYFDEPVFQDGIVAQAVNTVTAAGALYFSSAGNEGNLAKNTSGYFEGDYDSTGSPAFAFPGGTKTGTIHNFGTLAVPLNGDIITSTGSRYTLNWSDASGASANDYDLFVVSSLGAIKAQSTNIQSGTQNPYESITPPTLVSGDRLVVFKTAAAAVRAFAINTLRGTLTIGTTGQTHGHSAAINSFSVSATPAAASFGSGYPTGPYPNPFTATNQVELFTSDGQRRVFYDASGNPITAGNFLFSTNGGTVRNKPDITAADGVSTTLPSTSGLNPFYGTSAAAPHAAAIAALLKSANPLLTPAQIRTILTTTALDIESAGYDNISGFGIVQAFQAMQAVNPTPLSNISLVISTVTEGATGTNNNGFIEPGENGKIVVQLSNPSTVSATAVSATLTTSTAGVTITQGSSSYGTIAASGNSSNTATPYTFTVSNSAACGTAITFSLSVTFGGGGPSPKGFVINVNLGYQPGLNINSTLGSVPPTASGFTSATGTQTGRLNRNSPVSSCGTQKTTPILAAVTGARAYDSYTLTSANTADQCVTVTLTAANGNNMYLTAYNSLGYIPATPNINFLADQGSSATVQSFGFTDTAGKSFTMVVHEVNPGGAVGSAYNLSVSLSNCSPVSLPLTWLSFTATEINKQALLQWKVANEINVSRYEVEYCVDGINFIKLYTLPATSGFALEKTYQQVHPFPAAGLNYYRVKQIDFDGHYTYSRTAIIKMNKINAVTFIPNPASSVVTIQSVSIMNRIQLFSAVGQLLVNVAPAAANYNLPVSQLPSGQYFLRIETDKEIINQKIIKQ